MRDGAMVANAGHFDVEVNVGELAELAVARSDPRGFVSRFELPDGRAITLLAKGRVVNLAAGAGHPAAVMDLSFAAQALAAEYLLAHGGSLEPRVHAVPEEIDAEARAAEARLAGDRDRRAQRGAAGLSGVLAAGDVTPTRQAEEEGEGGSSPSQ